MRSSGVRVDLAEVERIARGPEVMRVLEEIAGRVQAAAGPDYEVETYVGQNRARASVRTRDGDWPAMAREARDHRLVQALGSIGG